MRGSGGTDVDEGQAMTGAFVLGAPVQIAYAVPDAVEGARQFARDTGAGPFFVVPHIAVDDVVIRGRPGSFDHTSAYGQWGPIMVELVEDHGVGPSPVRDVYAPGASGLHHLAFFVDDPDGAIASLLELGDTLAMSARTSGGVTFHFVDARHRLGHMLELYRPTERLTAFYAMVAAAAADWDGSTPVRTVGHERVRDSRR